MITLKRCVVFLISFVLIWASLSPHTATASSMEQQVDSVEENAIKTTIDEYIKLKYEALHTITPQDYSNLVSDAPEAESYLRSELDKQEIEIHHARLNQLRYVQYEYFLDYKQITIDQLSNTATVSVTEGHDVVFEISDPIVSTMRNLEHVITLNKENGEWRPM